MTNAEKFQKVFGYYATEMWAKPEKEFLEWINAEALEQEPSCRNTRQVDLISRKQAIKEISDEFENEWEEADVNFNHGLNMALSIIKALNSVDRPKRGKWIDKGNFYICSECGNRMPYAVLGSKLSRAYAFMSDYCPNCGARMESDEE